MQGLVEARAEALRKALPGVVYYLLLSSAFKNPSDLNWLSSEGTN